MILIFDSLCSNISVNYKFTKHKSAYLATVLVEMKAKVLITEVFSGHPKIKLFITQGGLQSTDEAITAGVPLIGIPMLGDQWFNVEKYEYHKIGIRVNMETLTGEQLVNAINTVVGDAR